MGTGRGFEPHISQILFYCKIENIARVGANLWEINVKVKKQCRSTLNKHELIVEQ